MSAPPHGRRVLAVVTGVVLAVAIAAFVIVVRNERAVRPRDVARQAVVVASSEDVAVGRTADKPVDGRRGAEAPDDASWVSEGGDRAPWVRLEWPTPQTVGRVVMADLPGTPRDVVSAAVRFEDGSSERLDSLPEGGADHEVRFQPRRVGSLVVTLETTKPSGTDVGVADDQVWTANGLARAGLDPLGEQLAPCGCSSNVNIIANSDDLLFMSPDLLVARRSGTCMMTVVVTAADNGHGEEYGVGRQEGLHPTYAAISDVADNRTTPRAVVDGHAVLVETLIPAPHVSLLHLTFPEGDLDGGSQPTTGPTSLSQLWEGTTRGLPTVDGAAFDTRDDLTHTLREILGTVGPTQTNAVDPHLAPGDHSDYTQVARSVGAATEGRLSSLPAPACYVGYDVEALTTNVSGQLLAAKKRAFHLNAAHDPEVCSNDVACSSQHYESWLSEQYRIER